MEEPKQKIIPINISIVLTVNVVLNAMAYNTNEAKGIGYFYFCFIFMLINICFLAITGVVNLLLAKKTVGKDYLVSILFSLGVSACVFILFWFFGALF